MSGSSSPAMILRIVDLPVPEGPMMPTASPRRILRLAPGEKGEKRGDEGRGKKARERERERVREGQLRGKQERRRGYAGSASSKGKVRREGKEGGSH